MGGYLNDVWYLPGSGAEGEGEGEGGDGCSGSVPAPTPAGCHSADYSGDWGVDLVELLRVIQLYNTGGFHCAANRVATEDGFEPGAMASRQDCTPHASDYRCGPDWSISLSELLRLVQFYNNQGYHLCPGETTEDGYCPGTP